MPEKTAMPKKLIAEFTESYLEKIFYFCLKKTGDADSLETVKALEKYGYLHRSEGGYVPDVLVLNVKEIKSAFESLDEQTASELMAMAQNAKKLLGDLYDKVAQTVKSDLPKIFSKDEFRLTLATSNMYFSRGYVMSRALRSGWLKPADEVSYTIGAHIYE